MPVHEKLKKINLAACLCLCLSLMNSGVMHIQAEGESTPTPAPSASADTGAALENTDSASPSPSAESTISPDPSNSEADENPQIESSQLSVQNTAGAPSDGSDAGNSDNTAQDTSGNEEEVHKVVSKLIPHTSEVESVNNGRTYLKKSTAVPASYDPRATGGYLTSVKSQYPMGTCWTYAAIGATEAYLVKNQVGVTSPSGIDLDEQHLAYSAYHPMNDPLGLIGTDSTVWYDSLGYLNNGGNNWLSIFTLSNWSGYVPQMFDTGTMSVAAIDQKLTSLFSSDSSLSTGRDTYHLRDAYVINMSDVDTVKQLITKYGAADIAYHYEVKYDNETTHSYYYNGPTSAGSNHEVLVVGWDDNYSKDNFLASARPANDGAWLVRNSWGTRYGDNGYFWLSYEDTILTNSSSPNYSQATFYIAEQADNYDHCYQYDGTKISSWLIQGSSTSMANVYTAQNDEILNAVSFYTYDNTNVSYNVSVYLLDSAATSPVAGTAAASQSGIEEYSGYHTVSLANPVRMAAGQKYSVVIDLSKAGDNLNIVYDGTYDDTERKNQTTIEKGQSYLKSGTSWADMTNIRLSSGSISGNLRIKAFTNDVQYPVSYQFVSSDSSWEIPKDVLDLLPADTATYRNGQNVVPVQPSKTTVSVANGSWAFQGYDQSSVLINKAAVTFTGTWKYTESPAVSLNLQVNEPASGERVIRLYDASADKFAIRDDIRGTVSQALSYLPSDLPSADTAKQQYYFAGVPAGSYQLAVYQPGDAVAITDVEINDSATSREISMYTLGDISTDEQIDTVDVIKVRIAVAEQREDFDLVNQCDLDNTSSVDTVDVLKLRIVVAGLQ